MAAAAVGAALGEVGEGDVTAAAARQHRLQGVQELASQVPVEVG